jgi:hypothetical protein
MAAYQFYDLLISSVIHPLPPDSTTEPYLGGAALARRVRATAPGGADAILVCESDVEGYAIMPAGPLGIIAILIGLIKPKLLSLGRENSIEGLALRSALAPGGRIGVALAGRRVLELPGPGGAGPAGWPGWPRVADAALGP